MKMKYMKKSGKAFPVKLPRKEGHMELPTNYSTSLRRLESRVARLERNLKSSGNTNTIINYQLDSGVIKWWRWKGERKCTIYLTKLLFSKRAKQPR